MLDDQNELFVVVDKNDKIIEYRTRFDCHHDKSLIHRAVGIVIFNDNGEILLQKRSQTKDLNPGMYTLSAAGHVSRGETYEQTAQRELTEELGIQSVLKKQANYLAETMQETEMNCLFTARYNGPFYPNRDEVDEIKFVKTTQLQEYSSLLTPFAILSLKQLSLL